MKNVTVSQSCGKWYISIQTESEVSTPVHPSASMVGLDAGVAKLATLSDGTVFEPVNSFQKNQKKLARLQRQLSRKVKFSDCIPVSQISAGTTFTKSQRPSAKTTQ
ncbi:putative transposase family protein [Escherichia coli 5-172-05_S3_C1]|nr:putative transposase family protein [Escherichia coli 5-172-05_S3_C1]OSL72543.1 putative virulence protein [Escherichia coli TA008]